MKDERKIMGSGDIMGTQIGKNLEDSGLSWGIRMFLNFAISNALKMHSVSSFYQNFLREMSPNPLPTCGHCGAFLI